VSGAVDALHDAGRIRRAGADLLSLALMDVRNQLLRWSTVFEASPRSAQAVAEDALPPLWLLGQAGWFQEVWIARNVQRGRGLHCDASVPKLASIEPHADRWYDPRTSTPAQRWQLDLPGYEATRGYLVETLETTLELLQATVDDDDALHFFRLALRQEDRLLEALAEQAQLQDLEVALQAPMWPELKSRVQRDALWFPAQRWELGSARAAGFTPDGEKWAHEVSLPEFEIDAQAVNWSQFVEFVEDGGYDDSRLWSDAGRAWLDTQGRRGPRYVEQLGQGGVSARRHGRMQRLAAAQAVLHVSAHEAEAWCRWAGRRLPTEAEWELAAATASSRGFVWGDVWEWVAGSARPYPGYEEGPGTPDLLPPPGTARVLRGASWMTPARLCHVKARRFAPATSDLAFCGFRSCLL
jgi:ergothioneine biosynthesis protein EgtB